VGSYSGTITWFGEQCTNVEAAGWNEMAARGTSAGALIDVNELASRLGVQVRYVRRLVAERRIPYVKLGHLIRFESNEVEAWIDRARVPAMDRP